MGDTIADPIAFTDDYRADYYIAQSIKLQKMDVPTRTAFLRSLANDKLRYPQVYILCRLLFCAKNGGRFPHPFLGEEIYIGDTVRSNWPQAPILLYNGVPILVMRASLFNGAVFPVRDHLDDCLSQCDWNLEPLEPKTTREIHDAISNFVAERQSNLSQNDIDWLMKQAEPSG